MTVVHEVAPIEERSEGAASGSNFIRAIIENDLRNEKHGGRIVTRFPPEPNGYLHIGHAKSICLNFGLARDYNGFCNLRFDDTNPATEEVEYVESIKHDVRWLGFDWEDREFYASDYFHQLYEFAVHLIETGNAYVDSLNEKEIRSYRGTVTEPGKPSPYRDRSIAENLDLFRDMRAGKFRDGEHVLRAKIDLASNNMKMRDPLLYRIRHARHYRSGDDWCIYPMYDFAHPLSDALEEVTHSLCTLEFDNNRELYDWVLDNTVGDHRPHQYEFARLSLDYTVMSKRKLLTLVRDGHVSGWDDPRMPTLAGFRRRGVRPSAIRAFCDAIGVAKAENRVDIALLEHVIRNDLNAEAPRVMAVLRPLKIVISNYPEGETEWLDASYWPHDVPKEGSRKVPFSREILIDRDDFQENPPKGYYRLAPGREVRLRYGYFVRCTDVIRSDDGNVVELRCTYDPETRGGNAPDGRKVRGTIHWVSAQHAKTAEVRLYDRLFDVPDPEAGDESFIRHLNAQSLVVLNEARIEPSVADDDVRTRYQFEREGYFRQDQEDSSGEHLVFNRIVSLRDTWAKKQEERKGEEREENVTVSAPPPPSLEDRVAGLQGKARDRYMRLTKDYELSDDNAVALSEYTSIIPFFEEAVRHYPRPDSVAKWVVNEVLRVVKESSVEDAGINATQVAQLAKLVDRGTISHRIGKEVFDETIATGQDPDHIVEERGLQQVSDRGTLEPIIDAVIKANSNKVEEYRDGKTGLIGFFMGQVMRQTGGRAHPELVRKELERRLAG